MRCGDMCRYDTRISRGVPSCVESASSGAVRFCRAAPAAGVSRPIMDLRKGEPQTNAPSDTALTQATATLSRVRAAVPSTRRSPRRDRRGSGRPAARSPRRNDRRTVVIELSIATPIPEDIVSSRRLGITRSLSLRRSALPSYRGFDSHSPRRGSRVRTESWPRLLLLTKGTPPGWQGRTLGGPTLVKGGRERIMASLLFECGTDRKLFATGANPLAGGGPVSYVLGSTTIFSSATPMKMTRSGSPRSAAA